MADQHAALDAESAPPPFAPPPPQPAPPPQGTLIDRKRAADRARQARSRAAKKAKRTPSEVLSFAADASLDNLVPTPAASVHHAKAAKVLGIVDDQFMGNRHVHPSGLFYRWNSQRKLLDLFGKNLFEEGCEQSESKSNRFSYEMPQDDPWVKSLIERVEGRLRQLGILHPRRHRCGGVTLLLSRPGAQQQAWHTDFESWKRVFMKTLTKRPHSGCVPYPVSVLIALHKKGAWLRVRDFDDVHVDKYGAIVFRGDLTHAGDWWSSSDNFNWRIHLYFETYGHNFSCPVPRRGRKARARGLYPDETEEGRHITVINPPDPPGDDDDDDDEEEEEEEEA